MRERECARATVMNARIFRPSNAPRALSKWGAINNILFVIIIMTIKFASIKCRVEPVHFSEVPCLGSWFPHISCFCYVFCLFVSSASGQTKASGRIYNIHARCCRDVIRLSASKTAKTPLVRWSVGCGILFLHASCFSVNGRWRS